MQKKSWIIIFALALCILAVLFAFLWQRDTDNFPKSFLFGAATSPSEDCKKFSSTNANVSCNVYYDINKEISMLKSLGVDFYRFSLSWQRILPSGFSNEVSADGIRFYNTLINELLANDIKPFVVLYDWGLPKKLVDLGGFTNEYVVNYYEDYARVAFENFGDRVKMWSTFDEPSTICSLGNPRYEHSWDGPIEGISVYLCSNVLLRSHARVYHVYNDEFRHLQKGQIGIISKFVGVVPKSADEAALAERGTQFMNDWILHPILSKNGDYPDEMKEIIKEKSLDQGFLRSRLLEFTADQVKSIRGTYDFIGLNYNFSTYAVNKENKCANVPSFCDDMNVYLEQDNEWNANMTEWIKIRKHLNYLKARYDNPKLIINVNGLSDFEEINDTLRVDYMNEILDQLQLSIQKDGCNIIGFTFWPLMDSPANLKGVRRHYGLFEVDFESLERPVSPRTSALVYANIIENRMVNKTKHPTAQNERKVIPHINATLENNDNNNIF